MADSDIWGLPNRAPTLTDRVPSDASAVAPTSQSTYQQIVDLTIASTGFTPNSILIAGGSGQITENSADLNFDGTAVNIGGNISISDTSLVLHATDKAFIPNKLTTTQRDALNPVEGMEIYNSTTNQPEHYNGTAWVGTGSTTFNAVAPIAYDSGTENLSLNFNSNNFYINGASLDTIQNIDNTATPSFINITFGFGVINNNEIAIFNGSGRLKVSSNFSYNPSNGRFTAADLTSNTGEYNAAFGRSNTVSNRGNLTAGQNNTNSGENSWVGGQTSSTTADSSFVFGTNCQASSVYTFAAGRHARSINEGTFTWSSNLGGSNDFNNMDNNTAAWRVNGFLITSTNIATHNSEAIFEVGGTDHYCQFSAGTTAQRIAITTTPGRS